MKVILGKGRESPEPGYKQGTTFPLIGLPYLKAFDS